MAAPHPATRGCPAQTEGGSQLLLWGLSHRGAVQKSWMMVWALQYMGIRATTPETTKMIPEVSTKWTLESLFSKQAVHLAPAR